ncbi:hypothetical protein [Laspinema olomoucense]|uniref:hypothetical protein n=1 Tax=Laspinema olomoucense TaxID=3231600 RepID=UPI0021BAF38F|nr:hypothetical protein [Laspinema sp. D3a]MCT7991819.1 hypothetical protein [Laspinema sp. D3a]
MGREKWPRRLRRSASEYQTDRLSDPQTKRTPNPNKVPEFPEKNMAFSFEAIGQSAPPPASKG